jgi:hypothetical protein
VMLLAIVAAAGGVWLAKYQHGGNAPPQLKPPPTRR